MRIHSLTVEQALTSLNSSAGGLSASEAARRLAEFGPNHLEEVEREHLLLRLAREFTHFFAIILWIGAALAFFAEHFDPGQGMARLGVAIIGVIIINGVFSFWQEYKAERAVAALRQLLPQKATALRAGEIVEILASDLVPGDILLLEEGDFVPADCRLIAVFGLRVTLSLAMATQRMAKRNALVRHLPAVEALGSTTVICSDKTGTLTQNRMSVQQLWLGGAFLPCADLATNRQLAQDHRELFVNAALCHDLKEVDEQAQRTLHGDPMEVALAAIGRQVAGDLGGFTRVDEIPFDTDRKRMSVLCNTPQGRMLYCKGALENVLATCRFIHFDAGVAPLDPAARTRLLAAQDEIANAGLRVLAFAQRTVDDGDLPGDEQGMTLAGLIGLADPPRAEVPEAIARCNAAGIRIIMVTGDHPRTALAIARQIRMVRSEQPVVIIGEQLRLMSATQLQLALDAPEILFARVAAEQKMRIVEALKQKGEIVAVTGDGVNDAPALKSADIGIAMGISGTWLLAAGCAALMWSLEELRKAALRRTSKD